MPCQQKAPSLPCEPWLHTRGVSPVSRLRCRREAKDPRSCIEDEPKRSSILLLRRTRSEKKLLHVNTIETLIFYSQANTLYPCKHSREILLPIYPVTDSTWMLLQKVCTSPTVWLCKSRWCARKTMKNEKLYSVKQKRRKTNIDLLNKSSHELLSYKARWRWQSNVYSSIRRKNHSKMAGEKVEEKSPETTYFVNSPSIWSMYTTRNVSSTRAFDNQFVLQHNVCSSDTY